MRHGSILVPLLVTLSLHGCSPKKSIGEEIDDGTTGTGGDSGGSSQGDNGDGEDGGTSDGVTGGNTSADDSSDSVWDVPDEPPATDRHVDVLFVIDNSGSMGEEQGVLSPGVDALVNALDGFDADYRIGFTTTDNGNPWCDGTTPEGGALVLSSCLGRQNEFIYVGTDPPTDRFDEACEQHCEHENIAIAPTPTDADPTARPRPWIERSGGKTNLPDSIPVAEAFRCFAPQGINGCGFESPLESMGKAVRRAADAQESSYGFIHEGGVLAIVIVTDEVDCSYQPGHQSIFLPDGNRTFWSDPDAAYPSSAVCWNAGVTCTGGPGTYSDCVPADKDVHGNLDVDNSLAVLRPLSRYIDLLQEQHPQATVIATLAGVPEGYSQGEDIVYADTDDELYQGDFGIGPGCTSANGAAIPPVRTRVLVETMPGGGREMVHSICSEDYGPASAIASAIEARLPE